VLAGDDPFDEATMLDDSHDRTDLVGDPHSQTQGH
jgi:hypothetical protein